MSMLVRFQFLFGCILPLNYDFKTKTRRIRALIRQICCSLNIVTFMYTQLNTAANSGVSTKDTCVVVFVERYKIIWWNLIYCLTERDHIWNYISYFIYSCKLCTILVYTFQQDSGRCTNTWQNYILIKYLKMEMKIN